ncbi:MAG: glycerol-3-phosphate dehydrogenase [Marinosulfonomonas sp.]|nr:glycerol-3-phosphate dehydrogenase [Marinosulfonomonas sp.]
MNVTPPTPAPDDVVFDLVVIGGGINGCGIARDAAGRGLSVLLCEKDDLAQATSSASTKLFHGGLRYLEYFEFGLVRKALREREVLLKAMPHISWPMRFVLPYDPDLVYPPDGSTLGKILGITMPFLGGRRPAWLVRAGLFVYDYLGGRKILPPTRTLNMRTDKVGKPLKPKFKKAFEYSDCWVNDARLVVLNARDAADHGADIRTGTICTGAEREGNLWRVGLHDTALDETTTVMCRGIVNAGGPWVSEILQGRLRQNTSTGIRLVRGSHIVTRKLFDHDQPYFFQLSDGRIIFAIPYEQDFTLIGTTDQDHDGDPADVHCTPQEQDYLLSAANDYFQRQLTAKDVVWTYSGVRPLYDDGASSATSATRDYVLTVIEADGQAPLLNVFGGKITTYRKLAEEALADLNPYYPDMPGNWTANAHLPGGDFPVDGFGALVSALMDEYPFLSLDWASRMVRSYGTLARVVYDGAKTLADLGQDFGATLFQREVTWLVEQEWAVSADDIVWRRSKLGLRMSGDQIAALQESL